MRQGSELTKRKQRQDKDSTGTRVKSYFDGTTLSDGGVSCRILEVHVPESVLRLLAQLGVDRYDYIRAAMLRILKTDLTASSALALKSETVKRLVKEIDWMLHDIDEHYRPPYA